MNFGRQAALILGSALFIKLFFLPAPLLGHFGSYQVTNAMMAERMLDGGAANFFIPRTNLILDGKPAMHLLYYPFASLFAAGIHAVTGIRIDFLGRLQAALFMLLSGWLIALIGRRLFNERAGLAAAFLFSFFPMNLILGISFQNESLALFLMLAGFTVCLTPSAVSAFMGGLCFSLALIARIHFITAAPFFAFLYLFGFGRPRFRELFLFAAAALAPLSAWYAHLWILQHQFPDSVQTSMFSQAGDGRILKPSLLLNGAFYKRLSEVILGSWMTPVVLPIVLAAAAAVKSKEEKLLLAGLAGTLTVIVLLPQKVNDHPFYLAHSLPFAAMLAAGWIDRHLLRRRIGTLVMTAAFLLFTLRFFLPPALSAYREAVDVVGLGKAADRIIPTDSFLIAQHGSAPDLLYYSGRKGGTLMLENRSPDELAADFSELLSRGADYLLISEPEKLRSHRLFSLFLDETYANIPLPAGIRGLLYALKEKKV